jgi:hypothetical protein
MALLVPHRHRGDPGMTYPHDMHNDYFVSGSNHAGEIRGLAFSGMHIGVSVNALDKAGASLRELEMCAGSLTRVFVDSGAFGEVKFDRTTNSFVDVKPITDSDWDARISVYERLAASLKSQLYIVAPDKVGDQVQTLCRLERYADRIKRMAVDHHVNVIVPMQRGDIDMIDMDRCVREIFDFCSVEGGFNFIRGIPSKKGAMDAKTLAAYCTELMWDSDIDEMEVHFHLLGLGPYSKRYPEIRNSIPKWAAGVTCDSVRITALVGRTNGPGGGPRDLTRRRIEIVAKHPELPVDEVKFRMVQGHFMDEHRDLLEQSHNMGWYDPELAAIDGNGQIEMPFS